MKSLSGVFVGVACGTFTFLMALAFAAAAGGAYADEHRALTAGAAAVIGLSAGFVAARSWRGR